MMRLIVILVTLFFTSVTQASPETTPKTVPRFLHIWDGTAGAFVDLVPHGCSGARYNLSQTHPLFKEIFSVLLTAQISGKPVLVRFDGCNGSNQGKIVGVYLQD